MDLSVVPYGEVGRSRAEAGLGLGGGAAVGGKYRECLRNHAAAMGGQAYDGCGEFMPGGEGGSMEALKCAACGCHRNFHRREDPRRPLLLYGPGPNAWDHRTKHSAVSAPLQQPPPGFAPFFAPPIAYHQIQAPPGSDRSREGSETPPPPGSAMPAPMVDESAAAAAAGRKRFRTKFTPEQKERMKAFAERLGWRIQKHDDAALEEFCMEIGVKRHVLKVWMHNNKNSLASSPSPSSSSPHPQPDHPIPLPTSRSSNPEATSAPPIRV